MAADIQPPSSRRAVLIASVGGMAALIANALGRPLPAHAADDDPMVVGGEYTSETVTKITTTGETAIQGVAVGSTGVQGDSTGGSGVFGSTETGFGVQGFSLAPPLAVSSGLKIDRLVAGEFDLGVLDTIEDRVGVHGHSSSGTGVFATSDSVSEPALVARSDAGHIGVAGIGSVGVLGATNDPTGVGAYALAANAAGLGLLVFGKASFGRSGRASVLKNRTYVDVSLISKGGLSGSPLCFANLMSSRSGTWVRTVRPNYPVSGKMRIYLNKVASTTLSSTVAWIVMG